MPTTYAIPNGSTVMAATTYTGTGAARSVSNSNNGVSFQPDWVWIKERSSTSQHALFDSVRGVQKRLISDTTAAEDTSAQLLTAFNSDGFSVGTDGAINESAQTYVAWNWKAGGAAVTNTSGTISSQVSANPTAGFSVVTASASGTSPVTIGHGLGVAPRMIIGRVRNNTASWYVYHSSIAASDYLVLNSTAARATSSNIWDTAPTSTVFTVGNPQNGWNGTTSGSYNYVFYCFTPVAGYSAFGSYTGNGSADGPFVYLGFRPRFIMWKRTDTTSGWSMHDTSRDPYNISTNNLFADSSGVEDTGDSIIDLLSNGFKLRNTYARANASAGTYIYAAFAEAPFKFSNGR